MRCENKTKKQKTNKPYNRIKRNCYRFYRLNEYMAHIKNLHTPTHNPREILEHAY